MEKTLSGLLMSTLLTAMPLLFSQKANSSDSLCKEATFKCWVVPTRPRAMTKFDLAAQEKHCSVNQNLNHHELLAKLNFYEKCNSLSGRVEITLIAQ